MFTGQSLSLIHISPDRGGCPGKENKGSKDRQMSETNHVIVIGAGAAGMLAAIAAAREGAAAVSYTHLDVYKRQRQSRP